MKCSYVSLRAAVLLVLCFALASGAAWAQLTLSTVRGTAADPTGAVVANAEITVVSEQTGFKRVVKTSDSGDFEVPDLQRGTYKLSATHPGFKTFVAENIILEGNQVRRVNVTFELGAVGAEVTVQANAAVIQTDTSRLQSALNTSKHFDTPWVGAEATFDPSLFITTLPMVSQTGGVWSSQWAGQASAQVQEGQDGHTNDNAVNQLNNILDTQEITVVTVNNTAEFARVGYMNLVTKSGSNDFHARASYWHQNSALGAREFFEEKKAKQLLHTISIQGSGPIIKNRTFFYASANILKVPSKQFYLRDVPTAKMRQGDFSQLLTQRTPTIVRDPLNNQPFPNNIIPANRISALSLKVNEKYLPAPNRGGPDDLANNFGFTFPFPTDYALRKDFTQRIDHQITSKNRIMGRMVEDWGLYVLPSNFPSFAWTRVRFNIHAVFEDTHIFTPNLVNTFRVGLYKEKVTDGDPLYGVTPFKGDEAVKELGLQGVNPKGHSAQGFPVMNITGYPALQTQPGGEVQNDHNWGYADTMTWSKGRHVLKFGGEYKPQSRYFGNIPTSSYGNFSFNGRLSNYGYADFLLGLPFSSSRLDPFTKRTRLDNELGLFITDSWKVNSKLTLDLGIRWDRFGSPSFEDGLLWNWDKASTNVVISDNATGRVSPLYPKSIKIVTGNVRVSPDNSNIVPRVGFAYRINDNTVVRGGYGMFTETIGRYARLLTGGPFEITETYQNVIENGRPLFQFPNPFPASLDLAGVPSQSVTAVPDPDNGRIHQFNLTLERQWKDVGFRLSYVGSRNRGMNYGIGINKPQPSLTPFTAARRPYSQFIGVTEYRTDGAQNFNAMTFEVQRKVGQLTFNPHWTWASNYTNMQNLENPYAGLSYGRDQYTPRHRVVINVVWELPFGKGRQFLNNVHPVVNGALGGWQIYWIGYLETGHFFTPSFSGSDPSNTNTVGGRPDRVCNGNLPSGERNINRWFDASCFTAPPQGRFGNAGGFILEGPGYNMQHMSVAKTFTIWEKLSFTYTAAFANVFNHANFNIPAANISVPGSVGRVSSLVEGAKGRHIEMRGRIDF